MNCSTGSINCIDVEIVLINDGKVEVLICDLSVILDALKKINKPAGKDEVETHESTLDRWRKSSFKVT